MCFVSILHIQTVENAMCILRNLSYHLESEIDPQEGAEDVLDKDWEAEQRRNIDSDQRPRTVGCFAFLRPSGHRSSSSLASQPIYDVNFANPGTWRLFTLCFSMCSLRRETYIS